MIRPRLKLEVGRRVRVAIPNIVRLGPDRRVLDGTMREEIGTIIHHYPVSGAVVVEFQMPDRVVVGLAGWIAGPALDDGPAQLGLFEASV